MELRPPISTLFPYTTLFRSVRGISLLLRPALLVVGPALLGGHNVAVLALFRPAAEQDHDRSEERTSELQSPDHLVCRFLLEKKKEIITHKKKRRRKS